MNKQIIMIYFVDVYFYSIVFGCGSTGRNFWQWQLIIMATDGYNAAWIDLFVCVVARSMLFYPTNSEATHGR